jgi:hypothetical protein
MKKLIDILKEAFGDDVVNQLGDPDRPTIRKDLVGKTPAEIQAEHPELEINTAKVIKKPVQYAVEFKASEDFRAIHLADEFLKDEGYVHGSMNRDMPMLVVKGDGDTEIKTRHPGEERYAVITKWDRLSPNQYDQLDGIIVTDKEGFRDGGVFVLLFNYF